MLPTSQDLPIFCVQGQRPTDGPITLLLAHVCGVNTICIDDTYLFDRVPQNWPRIFNGWWAGPYNTLVLFFSWTLLRD